MQSGGHMPESVLLLSGGLDSATLAYTHNPDLTVTVDYGQCCADAEIQASEQIADQLNLEHEVIEVDCRSLGAGTMAGKRETKLNSAPEWWPYRNQLVITLVAMDVVRRGADRLLIGAVADDQDHADGKEEFFELIDSLLSFQEGNLRVKAPAIDSTTEEFVREANPPESLLGWTHSCTASNAACGECGSCKKRQRVLSRVF
ncbi:7-cyano-7-deazaguanine synthase [Halovivax gelatinilyticus]|uniref:7-cyano-7-deazaguanine synthase n=1 Tax=Halovivax gelatinilyticus TaxID=2961597 RepID=UPI0020CA63EC|nr:7-cyano-7-deazaguanine synthase [Halovivax gelatinilyticus]